MLVRVDVAGLDAPGLEPYRTLRRSEEHVARGIFVAEGGTVVERLLASGLEVVSLLLSPRWLDELAPRLERRPERLEVFVASEAVLSDVVGFRLHQGVMAVARVPAPVPLEATLAVAARPRLVVALDRVVNAENLGVVARSAAAFAVAALVVGETTSSPWLRRAVRVSMGGVFLLPVHFSDDLAATLVELGRAGFLTATAAADGEPADGVDLSGDCCLVLGHEDRGVRPAVRAACRQVVAVPMPGGVDSLNVATAAGVLMYEARRQQR